MEQPVRYYQSASDSPYFTLIQSGDAYLNDIENNDSYWWVNGAGQTVRTEYDNEQLDGDMQRIERACAKRWGVCGSVFSDPAEQDVGRDPDAYPESCGDVCMEVSQTLITLQFSDLAAKDFSVQRIDEFHFENVCHEKRWRECQQCGSCDLAVGFLNVSLQGETGIKAEAAHAGPVERSQV